MPKKIQLSIPNPCHENWNAMTPVEKGRFCNSCRKQVMDFTNMSDSQLVAFFKKKSTGSVCGRFMPEQLNRAMDIPKKRIPWVKYFFQFTLPLFISSLKAGAQPSKQLMGDTVMVIKPVDSLPIVDTVITQEWEEPPPPPPLEIKDIRLEEIAITLPTDPDDCIPARGSILGKEYVLGGLGIEILDREPHIQFIEDGMIKIYPNPLPGGSAVNIECKNLEEDFYDLQVLTQSGQPVFQKQIWIDIEATALNLPLPKINAGMYFMVLTSRQKKKKYSEKIIIQ